MKYIYTHKNIFGIEPKDHNKYHYVIHIPSNKAVWKFKTKKKAKAFCEALTSQSFDWSTVTDLGKHAEVLCNAIDAVSQDK